MAAPDAPDAPDSSAETAAPAHLAIIDIDGVVADVRHRLHHLEGRRKDWASFFADAAEDPPLAEGLARVLAFVEAGWQPVFLTGRPEHLRAVTEDWLATHGLAGVEVVMRRAGDRRPARFAKAEALRRLARRGEVAVVLDDDPDVIAHLRDQGWPVELASWVPRPGELHEAQERDGRT